MFLRNVCILKRKQCNQLLRTDNFLGEGSIATDHAALILCINIPTDSSASVNNNTCDKIGISQTFVLKAAADELASTLALLFQLSLDQGEISSDWREALVVPIFKKGDNHQASSYRPVSLTSITCKLLEHISHSSVMKHFD